MAVHRVITPTFPLIRLGRVGRYEPVETLLLKLLDQRLHVPHVVKDGTFAQKRAVARLQSGKQLVVAVR